MHRLGMKSGLLSTRQIAARLTLLAFVLRALVPAGFMPGFAAHADGGLEIVLCTAHGDRTIPADPALPHKSPGADCPFGATFAKGFVVPAAPAALPQIAVAADSPLVAPAAPASLFGHGPPLGPRAPPLLIG